MNYKKLADEKRKELSSLFTRMKQDEDFLYLSPYKMKDLYGKIVPGVLHTTLNDPAMFAAWAKAEMANSKEQWEAIGDKLDDNDTSLLEDWTKRVFDAADDRLRKQGIWELDAFLDEQSIMRGRAGARCLFYKEGDVIIPDIVPLDTMFLAYDTDEYGLTLVAPEFTRNKAIIAKEYPDYKWIGTDKSTVKVTDLWVREDKKVWNEVYIGNTKIAEREPREILGYDIDYIPFVIQTVQMGSSLMGDDYEARRGESIFWMVRDIIPIMNEIASILRSINFRAYEGAYTFDSGYGKQPPEPPVPSSVTTIDPNAKGYSLVQMQDMQAATMNLWSIVDQRWQAATRSRIEEGTLAFQLSAIAINDLKAERDTLVLPRLRTRALIKLSLQEMFTKQCLAIGGSIEMDKRTFNMSELDLGYQMAINYDTRKPRDEIAAVALMNAWGNQLSLESKLRDIAKVDDVGKEMRLLSRQKAELAEPGVAYYELAHDYIDMAEDVKPEIARRYYNIAKMMAEKGAAFYKQIGQPPQVKEPQPSPQAGSILPPLMGGGK